MFIYSKSLKFSGCYKTSLNICTISQQRVRRNEISSQTKFDLNNVNAFFHRPEEDLKKHAADKTICKQHKHSFNYFSCSTITEINIK